jgi:hypothetical protein
MSKAVITVVKNQSSSARLVFTPTACILFLFLIAGIFSSCKYFKKKQTEKSNPVARVGNYFLYAEDLAFLVKDNITDSATLVKSYIDDWVRRKLLFETAEKYLPSDRQNLDRQIQDYRESLLIYLYEDELLKQKLDTTVSDVAIDSFYEANRQNFLLDEDLVQLMYIKMAKDAPKTDSVKYLMSSGNEKKRKRLMSICYRYAADFYLKDSLWLPVKSVNAKMPVEQGYLRSLRTGVTGEVADSNYLYFLKVNEYKEKGTVAPLNEKIYQDAIKEGNFEVFSK